MKTDTLSTSDIDNMMKDIPQYRGCFPKDYLNNLKPNTHEYLVLNTDNLGGPGIHWVAVCNKPDSDMIEFFDSYGAPIPETILNYMKKSGKQVVGTNNEIQGLNSKACGAYAVNYLKRRYNNESIYDILYSFSFNNLSFNDEILKNQLKQKKNMEDNYFDENDIVYDQRGNAIPIGAIIGAIPGVINIGKQIIEFIKKAIDKAKEKRRLKREQAGKGYDGGMEMDGEGISKLVFKMLKRFKPSPDEVMLVLRWIVKQQIPENIKTQMIGLINQVGGEGVYGDGWNYKQYQKDTKGQPINYQKIGPVNPGAKPTKVNLDWKNEKGNPSSKYYTEGVDFRNPLMVQKGRKAAEFMKKSKALGVKHQDALYNWGNREKDVEAYNNVQNVQNAQWPFPKAKRAPSQYNIFVKDYFAYQNSLGQKGDMKSAAAAWQQAKLGASGAGYDGAGYDDDYE